MTAMPAKTAMPAMTAMGAMTTRKCSAGEILSGLSHVARALSARVVAMHVQHCSQ